MNLFSYELKQFPFQLFSYTHITMLFIFLAIGLLFFVFKETLRKYEKAVKAVMFGTLFIFEALYHYWLYKNEQWDVSFTLPLQLCSISLILCLFLLVTDSKLLFQFVYFFGIAGALQALITPELFFGFPHFRFFQFFITHMLIIWVALFYMFVKKYTVTFKGLWQSFILLNIFALIAFFTNKLVNGNYMFLANKPVNPTLLDYLGPYPFYIFVLEGLALLIFFLLYLPWRRKEK